MGATFNPLPGEAYLRPAGSHGPFEASLGNILPRDRAERPRITVEDLSGALEVRYTMPADALNALERMCCEAAPSRTRHDRRAAAARARRS
jgi:hypothetical protein